LITELGGLDLMILSSGTGDVNPNLDFEIDRKVIDVNVTGFTNILDWGYNYFEKQAFGHLVAITSVAGIRGSREAPSYSATKSYQIKYLEGLRQKTKKTKKSIFITDIRPGLVDTEMAKGDGLFWVMPVGKVAKQIFKSIKNKKNVVYVTKRWGFIGRLLKILPRFIYIRM
jgi:short-subunit dehydrogenase